MSTNNAAAPLLTQPRDEFVSEAARSALATSFALLFHTAGRELQLVTAHNVVQDRNRAPIIAAGRPLTSADERDILDLLTSRTAEQGFTQVYPERLLFADQSRTLWWLPSAVRPMHLRNTKGAKTIRTRWPALVLLAQDRTLFVAALSNEERPSASTPLFHSTLPNVYGTSQVCTGDAALPLTASPQDIPHWESVLCDSAFTHANFGGALRGANGKGVVDVETFWRTRNGKVSAVPAKRMVPMRLTLSQWFIDPTGARA